MDESKVDLLPYAGRWVALIGEQVAGVGHTAVEAMRLARRNRPKEKMTVQFVEAPGGDSLALSPLFARLRPLLAQQERPVYLVGGAVRDALLGRISHDLDFVVPDQAIKLAFRIGNELDLPVYILDRERDAGRVVLSDEATTLDFTRFRGPDLETDLRDRDFTINAIALPAAAETSASLIDPCDGRADLAAGLIRQTHETAVVRDPVRALRAVRLAFYLDFRLTPETETAVTAAIPHLNNSSIERLRDELAKLLRANRPGEAVAYLERLGLLAALLPEIAALASVVQSDPHHEPVLPHTVRLLHWLARLETAVLTGQSSTTETAVLNQAQAVLSPYTGRLKAHFAREVSGSVDGLTVLRLGALFHDVGKAETQTIEDEGRIRFIGHDKVGAGIAAQRLRHLHFSNELIDDVKKIVAGHMRPLLLSQNPQISRRAVYRFFKATGAAGLDIGLLSLADHLATYDDPSTDQPLESEDCTHLLATVAQLYHHYFNLYEETILPRSLLDGRELMDALQLPPGPEVGRLLRLIEEAQAAGEVTTREEALLLVRQSRH